MMKGSARPDNRLRRHTPFGDDRLPLYSPASASR